MHKITVEPFGESFECGADETILGAALRARLFLRYGCRHGGCGTCKVQVVDGDLDITATSFALSPDEREMGTTLICQSYPLEDCVVDASSMNLTEEEFFGGNDLRSYPVEVESVEVLTSDIRRVRLRHTDGNRMPFVAGQFVNVGVPGTEEQRSFSMTNGPADPDRIELICKLLPGGLFSGFLATPPPAGTQLTVTGPLGMLAVRLSHRSIVMVAGGSGLAPLLSMLRDLAARQSMRPVTLFFGARTAADLYAQDEIGHLQTLLPGLEFVPVVEVAAAGWSGATGLVTEAMSGHRDSYEGSDAYLCGPPPMIDAATAVLLARGVRPQNVHFDAFVPTGGTTAAPSQRR